MKPLYCPFCGSFDHSPEYAATLEESCDTGNIEIVDPDTLGARLVCNQCGAMGPVSRVKNWHEARIDARRLWEERTCPDA